MDLVGQLEEDLKAAAKLRDEVRLTTLRLLKSALKNYQIEVGHDLTMQEALQVLQREAKKYQDAINTYQTAGREDLVKAETAELAVLKKYLPEQMNEDKVRELVKQAISETGAQSSADMGKVIGLVREKSKGAADGAMIAAIAKQELS